RTIDALVHPGFAKNRPGYFGFYLTGSDHAAGYSWGWPEWFFGSLPPVRDAAGKLNFRGNAVPAPVERGNGPNQFILGEQFFRYMVMSDPNFDARSFDIARDEGKLRQALGDMLD